MYARFFISCNVTYLKIRRVIVIILVSPKAEDHQANMHVFGFLPCSWCGSTASLIAGYFCPCSRHVWPDGIISVSVHGVVVSIISISACKYWRCFFRSSVPNLVGLLIRSSNLWIELCWSQNRVYWFPWPRNHNHFFKGFLHQSWTIHHRQKVDERSALRRIVLSSKLICLRLFTRDNTPFTIYTYSFG
jgi:hypothetical protein